MGEAIEKPQERLYASREEYLALEEQALSKHEYYNGEVIAMAGATVNHNIIFMNISGHLFTKLQGKPCRPYGSDMKLDIPRTQSFVYPDAMVICGKVECYEDRQDVVTNPLLVVEVISESSVGRDRNEKLVYYQSLASVQEYLLIDSRQCRVDTFFRKSEREWQMLIYQSMDEIVLLQSLGIEVSMQELYEEVEL